jgi:MoaA/NifB/PqqE/SkfB family radical SAM enzyme
MRFPVRLSAELFRTKVSRRLSGLASPPIFQLSPLVTHPANAAQVGEESPEHEWRSPSECLHLVESQRVPIVWLGRAEPMLHPEIGSVTSALISSGRHVFLHTGGAEVRKRMHEFAPVPRLFFTFEFAGREDVHDRFVEQPGSFRRNMEGIRVAKLSGFYVCAHVTVTDETDPAEIGQLFEFLDARDVDGFIVSSGGNQNFPSASDAAQEKLPEVRALVRCSRWTNFSLLLECSYTESATAPEGKEFAGGQAGACEESA